MPYGRLFRAPRWIEARFASSHIAQRLISPSCDPLEDEANWSASGTAPQMPQRRLNGALASFAHLVSGHDQLHRLTQCDLALSGIETKCFRFHEGGPR